MVHYLTGFLIFDIIRYVKINLIFEKKESNEIHQHEKSSACI